jgi:membrane protein DedA with SNARE-associated domain
LRFFTLNLIGAIVWAITFAYIGYGFGEASQYFIEDFERYGLYLLGTLVLAGFGIWLVTLIRHRRKAREHGLK